MRSFHWAAIGSLTACAALAAGSSFTDTAMIAGQHRSSKHLPDGGALDSNVMSIGNGIGAGGTGSGINKAAATGHSNTVNLGFDRGGASSIAPTGHLDSISVNADAGTFAGR